MQERVTILSVSSNLSGAEAEAALADTLQWIVNAQPPSDLAITGLPANPTPIQAGNRARFTPSVENGLPGVFDDAFDSGYEFACLVGTATPHLPSAFLTEAWGRLEHLSPTLVIGPMDANGFYLIGMNRTAQSFARLLKNNIFRDDFSINGIALPEDYKPIQEEAQRQGLSVVYLPPWYGIEQNRERLREDLRRGTVRAPALQILLRREVAAS